MRFFLILAGAVASVFVLAAVLLTLMVDPNKYTGDISALVKEKTGRELAFEGGVKLTFFPWLGLETGGVTLGQSPLFPDAEGRPFARVRGATVRVRLLPLLGRRVEIGKVALDGLELNLGRDEQGRANWSDFTGPETPQEGKKPEEGKPLDPGADLMAALADLALDGVRVQDAAVTWTDRQLGRRYALTQADLTLPAVRAGKAFDFSAAFSMVSNDPEVRARAEVTGQATLNLSGGRHLFSGLSVKVAAQGKGVPGGRGEYALGLAELKLDNAQRTAQASGLAFSAYGARVNGQFQATGLGAPGGAEYKGRLDVPDFNGRELSAALTGKAPDTTDAAAYQHITGSVEFKAGRGYLEIPNFSAKLDDAVVEGRFRASGIEQKSYSFNVRISGLDADRFLPPAKKDGDSAAQGREAAGPDPKKDELFPLETLRTMRLDGQVTAERMKVRGLRLQSLRLPMSAQNGVLDIGQIDARLYDGTLHGSLRVDASPLAAGAGGQPQLTLNLTASGIQGRPLASDLKGQESEFAGTIALDTPQALTAQGNTAMALKRSLNGRVRFALRDGVFPGVNLTSVVHEGARKAKKALGEAQPSGERSTRFGSIDGTAVVTQGVAAINDLDLKAPFLRGEGKGTVNIPTKQVDYTLRVRVVPNADGQGGGGALDMLGLVVPLRVTGPYDNPSYGTDYIAEIGRTAVDTAKAAGRVVGKGVSKAVDVVKGIGSALTGGKR